MIASHHRKTYSIRDIAADTRYALNGGPFGSKLVSSMYVDNGVPVIRGSNLLAQCRFSFEDLVFITEEKAKELKANQARPGDVIFTQRGTLGQVGIIPVDSPYDKFVVSQSQMKLTVDPSKAEALYVYYYFRQASVVDKIQAFALRSGVRT